MRATEVKDKELTKQTNEILGGPGLDSLTWDCEQASVWPPSLAFSFTFSLCFLANTFEKVQFYYG